MSKTSVPGPFHFMKKISWEIQLKIDQSYENIIFLFNTH